MNDEIAFVVKQFFKKRLKRLKNESQRRYFEGLDFSNTDVLHWDSEHMFCLWENSIEK